MARGKIDIPELKRLKDAGKSNAYCAQHFNVTPSAISQALKALGEALTKSTMLHHADSLSAADIALLLKVSEQERRLLDVAQMSLSIAKGDVKAVAKAQKIRKLLPRTQFSDPSAIYIQSLRELTNLLKFKKDLMMSMFDISTAAEFQREVLEIISGTSPELRREVINRLRQNKALAASLKIPRPSNRR